MGWLESSEGASLPRGVLLPGGRVKDWDGAAGAAAADKRLPDPRYLLPTVCTAQLGESLQSEQASAVPHPCGPSMGGT